QQRPTPAHPSMSGSTAEDPGGQSNRKPDHAVADELGRETVHGRVCLLSKYAPDDEGEEQQPCPNAEQQQNRHHSEHHDWMLLAEILFAVLAPDELSEIARFAHAGADLFGVHALLLLLNVV